MPTTDEIIIEAKKFRKALDLYRAEYPSVLPGFPTGYCKWASLLLTCSLLNKWPQVIVYGVSGKTKNHDGEDTISHYWIEIERTSIDITADQYNSIDSRHLNIKILNCRPFPSFQAGEPGTTLSYKIFNVFNREKYTYGLSELAEDTLEFLHETNESISKYLLRT